MNQTIQWFTAQLEERGMTLSSAQIEQFETYYRLLVQWNEVMNLTGITEYDAVYEKHFYDSITVAFFAPMDNITSIADIGSGAGFPSIPLKICFPHLKVLIVDSLNKRIQFLNTVVNELHLSDVTCLHGRAEDVARMEQYRDQFDLVTARAVARLNVLNEFCLPFVKKGGSFIAMKGSQLIEEIAEAGKSLKELQGSIQSQHKLLLPKEQSERHLVCIKKNAATPKKYPRKAGTPLKQPLM
ncbi:16S rRNA (guanine(527)-N(7))-methyltransferase RsmG [Paenibacillus sp. GXUN7292]|uniref:16S rRNA (guanine(527)-N(7))-methyltransferase RsmG n=1 Tax=Paenibacillus sp. GXUN7292 TaxID=3422499 RepID=UPI003D7DA133